MAAGAVVAHPADKYANATQPWMRYQPRVDTLTAYKPTMTQRIPDMVKDGLRALGLNKFAANAFGSPIADVLGYSPVGAVAQSWDAGQAAARAPGMFGKAGALGGGMALAALGAVPGGKALARKGGALAMDEASRMARAAEQGFDTSRPMYRGMSRAYDSGKTGNYQMFTSSPLDASEYAGGFEGANVLPAFTRGGKGATIDAGGANWNAIPRYALPDDIKAQLHPSVGAQVRTDEFIHAARDAGYDSATIQNVFDNISGTIRKSPRPAKNRDSELDALFAELDGMDLGGGADVPMIADQAVNYDPVTVHAAFDPANIRSKFAAFDPAKRGSANLLAGLGLGGLGYGMVSGSSTDWGDPTQY